MVQEHYSISATVKRYVSTGTTPRSRIQRLLNVLIVCLNADKDYIKFCKVLSHLMVTDSVLHMMIKGS